MTKIVDVFRSNRVRARQEAFELMWDNLENSIWWNHYAELDQREKGIEKVRIQYDHYHPTLVSFQTAFTPTVLEIENAKIREVLQFGAGRRLRSIYRAANKFADVAYPKRTDVATEDEQADLDDALMLIYIGIPAFFDALSVASYRSVEPKKFDEKSADLFSKKYMHAIDLALLHEEISPYISWYKRLTQQLRHRFAHRIPPYVPSAIHGQRDTRKYEELQGEYRLAMEEQRFDDLSCIMRQQAELGKFCSMIYFIEDDAQMHLQSTVLNDLLTFQFVALTLFERLLELPGFYENSSSA
ncbi:hypothetical protein SAMN04488118_102118 [Epibacterium ulvae]|uniref:Uncharacterized protein n=1 Tax=Epibacterium ulvae TaxID=1156985 RepID=A0A1G5PVP9_9RHOB|nr:hypothetical protein [Epibacterium ulvae]SCZ53306.1 hypothetical protein SAMN04488118_102118 [Epibacterium ulvae]